MRIVLLTVSSILGFTLCAGTGLADDEAVKVTVKPGTVYIVGASGDSLFPHLHYELRTGPGMKGVEGLPSYFGGFRRTSGSKTGHVERGQLDTGNVVENP